MIDQQLKVAKKAIRRAKSLYFRRPDSFEVLRECEEKGLAVAGIEGLELQEDGGITPRLDMIFDGFGGDWSRLSWDEFREACNSSALQFLEWTEERDDLIFDFDVLAKAGFEAHLGRRRRLG
jgi:hypothetical protein